MTNARFILARASVSGSGAAFVVVDGSTSVANALVSPASAFATAEGAPVSLASAVASVIDGCPWAGHRS